jgi:two-component system response regulator
VAVAHGELLLDHCRHGRELDLARGRRTAGYDVSRAWPKMPDQDADILLVEDNLADVKLTLHAFETAGLAHRVHVARDGVEALEFVFGAAADADHVWPKRLKLILLDLKLPRLDGYQVLKRVKSDPRTSRIPVVVLTSSREARDVMRNYEMAANSYVVKPVDFEKFTDLILDIGKYWLVIDYAQDHDA